MCLIRWQSTELFCKVVWSAEDMCGVLFERPIPYSVVMETLGTPEREAPRGPAASVANIPFGRRRGQLRSAEDS
jgi:hypothetical protein